MSGREWVTVDLPAARAWAHLAEAHALAGNVEAAKEFAANSVRFGRDFMKGRDRYIRTRERRIENPKIVPECCFCGGQFHVPEECPENESQR